VSPVTLGGESAGDGVAVAGDGFGFVSPLGVGGADAGGGVVAAGDGFALAVANLGVGGADAGGGVVDGGDGFALAVANGACWRTRCFDMVHLLVFQETIKTTQIGRFDGHVGRRWQLATGACQGDHGLGRERLFVSQKAAQRVVHGRLAVVGSVLQNPQVRAPCDLGSVFVVQPVVGHAKAAVGKEVLAITVILEGARLAHQLVDEVPVVDRVLVTPYQPR